MTTRVADKEASNKKDGEPRKFTWRELAKLNRPHNAHLAYHGKVYDVSTFISHHPGGFDKIMLGAGRDVTLIFDAYHPIGNHKVREKYYVGELVDNEHPVFPEMGEFYKTVRNRVDNFLRDNNIDPKWDPWMIVRYVNVVFLYFFFQFCMVYFHDNYIFAFVAAILHGTFAATIALTLSHDASHFAFTHKPWVWKLLGAADDFLVGVSHYIWLHQHVCGHHPYANLDGHDPDIHTKDDNSKADWRRLKYAQKWFPHYCYQHLWFPILYGLLAIRFRIRDCVALVTGRYNNTVRVNPPSWSQLFIFVGGKLCFIIHHIILPLYFMPWKSMVFFTLVADFFGSYYLTFVILASHVNDTVETQAMPDKDNRVHYDWAELQIISTTDYAEESWFWHFFSGGINQHKAHHMAVYVLQSHLPKIAPVVKQTCEEFGLPYHVNGTAGEAFGNHLLHLKKLVQNYSKKPSAVKCPLEGLQNGVPNGLPNGVSNGLHEPSQQEKKEQ